MKIEVKNLVRTYGQMVALDRVSLTADDGEFLALPSALPGRGKPPCCASSRALITRTAGRSFSAARTQPGSRFKSERRCRFRMNRRRRLCSSSSKDGRRWRKKCHK